MKHQIVRDTEGLKPFLAEVGSTTPISFSGGLFSAVRGFRKGVYSVSLANKEDSPILVGANAQQISEGSNVSDVWKPVSTGGSQPVSRVVAFNGNDTETVYCEFCDAQQNVVVVGSPNNAISGVLIMRFLGDLPAKGECEK